MDHNQAAVLVRPPPAVSAAAVGAAGYGGSDDGGGTVRCAKCAETAGDYLEPPDLSTLCCRCGGGVPLCRTCAAIAGGDGPAAATIAEVIGCFSCGRVVCPAAGCSTRCSNESCEVGVVLCCCLGGGGSPRVWFLLFWLGRVRRVLL